MVPQLGRRSRVLYLLVVLEMAAYGVTLAAFGASLPRVIRELGWTCLGAGAVLAPGVRIGAGAVVAAGAAVHRDVEAGVTVLGNPARVVRQTAAEHT